MKIFNVFFKISIIIGIAFIIYFLFKIENYVDNIGFIMYNKTVEKEGRAISQKINNGTIYYGNKNAKVSMQVFIDYQCPYCKMLINKTIPVLKSKFSENQLAIYFKNLPLHSNSISYMKASLYAHKQDKYVDFISHCINSKPNLTATTILKTMNLDTVDFLNSIKKEGEYKAIQVDIEDAKNNNIRATPVIIINNKTLIKGYHNASFFETIIREELETMNEDHCE